MKGSGYEGGIFGGIEYFITDNFSTMIDFYPVLIGLKSDDYKVSGIEFVFNAGINIYFGGEGNKKSGISSYTEKTDTKQTTEEGKPIITNIIDTNTVSFQS
ncbi:MAG: hypothetical protein QXJ06_05215, partial [Candidatus Aenigmatarchaeota archaeon]